MSMAASSYEWLIGTRYLRSAHRRGFVSFVALISVAGLMLGVAVLIVVLSVMNGFQKELRTRILGVASHLQLVGPDNRLSDWQSTAKAVAALDGETFLDGAARERGLVHQRPHGVTER